MTDLTLQELKEIFEETQTMTNSKTPPAVVLKIMWTLINLKVLQNCDKFAKDNGQ